MNTEEFNNISDRWRVLCAVMMCKRYFPTVDYCKEIQRVFG